MEILFLVVFFILYFWDIVEVDDLISYHFQGQFWVLYFDRYIRNRLIYLFGAITVG